MAKESLKVLCERAKKHEKITNATDLTAAIPDLIEVQSAVKNMQALIRTGKKVGEGLAAMCSAYALKHPGCFDSGLMPKEKHVNTGDLMINEIKYHFISGVDGYRRADGVNLSQEFLATLPPEWVRSKLEIDATGIDRSGISDADLLKKGLVRKEKNVWVLSEEA